MLIVAGLAFLFMRDITQKKHSVLRNYPIVGRFRYFFEQPRDARPGVPVPGAKG